ncbi:MAG TPA: hypothetical protein VHW26_06840 [Solirubrobacteraceae bacterium]|nr:hypothetical protein [Solirubrobacteraceae bacterium]
MRRPLLLVVVGLALAGCGSANSAANFVGQQATVAKVIDNLSTYGTSHQASNICNKIFAASVAAKLKAAGGTCDSVVSDALNDVDIFALTVQNVVIKGNTATVRVQSTSNGKNQVKVLDLMHEADGTWRITSFG